MFKTSMLAAALSAAVAAPSSYAADQKTRSTQPEAASLAALRAEISTMKQAYEQRLQALELRLQQAETAAQARVDAQATTSHAALASTAVAIPAQSPSQSAERANAPVTMAPVQAASSADAPAIVPAVAPAANLYNPAISMILGGTLQNLRQDPAQYTLQGFIPSGGEVGPGKRGFNLGESELTFAANIDPQFAGQLTLAFSPENEAAVEEAYIRTRALENGYKLKAGRMLSGIGYLNGQHAHTWDFVDAPLVYQAMLGGQYKTDGVQATWLAPLDQYLELGVEAGNGAAFPGNERNRNGAGAVAVFAHLGDDLGASTSYRAGLSYLRTAAQQRSFADAGLEHSFSGRSALWMADAILKWAPNGNATSRNLKLQGEYFRRSENGSLDVASASADPLATAYNSVQSGWYLQSVYQFMPNWRIGVRYDRMNSGTPRIGLIDSGALDWSSLAILQPYRATRQSVMLDYSPSEFSRLRLQFARDQSRPGVSDNQIFLQYIMSLGTHAAHAF